MGQDLTCSNTLSHMLRSDLSSQRQNSTVNIILASWQQSANSNQTAEQPKPVTQTDALFFAFSLPSTFCLFNGSFLQDSILQSNQVSFVLGSVIYCMTFRLGQRGYGGGGGVKLVSRDLQHENCGGHPRLSARVKFLCWITGCLLGLQSALAVFVADWSLCWKAA